MRKKEKKWSKKNSKTKTRLLNAFNVIKKRHVKKDCPKRKQKQKNQKDQNGDVVIVEKGGYNSARVLIAFEINQEGKWVIDFGCSFHMCPFKNHLFVE